MNKVFEKLLPWGTRRRYVYQLGFSALKIVRYQGWPVFSAKARKEISSKISLPFSNSYHRWINKNEPGLKTLELQKQDSLAFRYRPKISIVMPVWNSEKAWLASAIESVIKQTYANWELCIADGASTKTSVREVLSKYSMDGRIKIKFLETNLGISGNSNEAISLASGEFIAFLDHDDELAPFALFEVVKRLKEQPDLDFIYSDEDKISSKRKRSEPCFKPDWSPDLFFSRMYVGHLSVFRKQIVDEVRGFRSSFDGAQDYDMVLRIIEITQKIYHIPQILYHCGMVSGSLASSRYAKPYAVLAAEKALTDYMLRNHIPGEVNGGPLPGTFRMRRQIIGNPLVSIIIPTKDKSEVLKTCLESIMCKTAYSNYEIIVVDNQSHEKKTLEYFRSIENNPKVTILSYDKPFNFSAINNFAAAKTKGEHLLFLNNDTQVISTEWLSSMLEHSQRKEVGAVGAQLLFRNKSIQHCGIIVGLNGIASHPFSREYNILQQFARPALICNYSAVTAACLMIRKSVFTDVGGFDSKLATDFNDVDLCLKLRKLGFLIVYTPYAQLFHDESLTRGNHDNPEQMLVLQKEIDLMRTRWGSVINRGDPYYNPNLSLSRGDYSLKR